MFTFVLVHFVIYPNILATNSADNQEFNVLLQLTAILMIFYKLRARQFDRSSDISL